MSNPTLYARLDGTPAVDAADIFYCKVLSDDGIGHFFYATDMDDQRA